MIYAGIGSRRSPLDTLAEMKTIGKELAIRGWTLRSGGATGADSCFEQGCDEVKGSKEIFLPWKGFNNSTSQLFTPSQEALLMAEKIYPAWNNCSQGAKKLHARNCHQLLGIDLKTPADLVICWTPGGKEVGGTATAIKLARENGVRIINLAIEKFDITTI